MPLNGHDKSILDHFKMAGPLENYHPKKVFLETKIFCEGHGKLNRRKKVPSHLY